MSFGFAVGDILAIISLSRELCRLYQDAALAHRSLATELSELNKVLQSAKDFIESYPEHRDPTIRHSLQPALEECYSTLKRLPEQVDMAVGIVKRRTYLGWGRQGRETMQTLSSVVDFGEQADNLENLPENKLQVIQLALLKQNAMPNDRPELPRFEYACKDVNRGSDFMKEQKTMTKLAFKESWEWYIPSKYSVISYTGGGSGNACKISMNGTALEIEGNLNALRKRYKFEAEPRIIWVDSPCINQCDGKVMRSSLAAYALIDIIRDDALGCPEDLLKQLQLRRISKRWKVLATKETLQPEDDCSILTGKDSWIEWFLRKSISYRQLLWDGMGMEWQSLMNFFLRRGFLNQSNPLFPREYFLRVFVIFKPLLNVPAGKKRGLGKHTRLALSCLLWATPAAAETHLGSGPDASNTIGIFWNEVKSLLSKIMMPWEHGAEMVVSPDALLVASFLCTALTVLLFTIRRHDHQLKYFVTAGLVLSSIAGVGCSTDVQDFVFRYLFVGLNISMGLSFICHRYSARQETSFRNHGSFKSQGAHLCEGRKLESGNFIVEKIENM